MILSMQSAMAINDGKRLPGLAARFHKDRLRGDYVMATGTVVVLTLCSTLWNESVLHWFLVPVMACGVLSGVDIVRWLRGKLDLFDPKTIIACMAFYGFFVAPLMNVCWDAYGVGDLPYWGDWRPWLGAMAGLTALGLVAYRLAEDFAFAHSKNSQGYWEINNRRTYPFFAAGLFLSISGTVTFLWQMNGIPGLVRSYESDPEAFAGKGWLLIFAWPMSVLLFLAVIHPLTRHANQAHRARTLTIAVTALALAGAIHFLVVGSFGSRGTTVWALFWMLGIVHYRVRELPKKTMLFALMFLVGFMYLYGFYKEKKSAALNVLRAPSTWVGPEGYQRDFKYLLLGDLARADSNAFMLRNLVVDPGDYDYRWGLTYVGSLTFLIPRDLWPDRPEIRVDAGSEALWGKATQLQSSRLYGLGGEALLNFGAWGVVPIFGLYGALLGWYRRKLATWPLADARMFLVPFLTSLIVRALVYDSDVLLFCLITEGALVIFVLFLASKRLRNASPAIACIRGGSDGASTHETPAGR